jgi:polar amino acid transport system substrate-binding protein
MVLYKKREFFKTKGEEEMKRSFVIVSWIIVLGLMLSGCASAPTAAPTAAATAAATVAPTATPLFPAESLVEKGKLTVCTNLPYEPMEFRDEKEQLVGMDIDLGTELATRLGLKAQFVESVFDTIIPGLLSGKCDIIMSSMSVTTSRSKQVSFIPYYIAGISFMVPKGNPDNINSTLDLCGKKVAAQSGTYEVDFLQGTADYEGAGVSQACEKAGKKKVNVVITKEDSDAQQQLLSRKVSAYSADSPVVLNFIKKLGDQFQTAGEIYDSGPYGIAIPCGAADCSTAPFSPLGKALNNAFQKMLTDGGYDALLAKWNLAAGTIKK